jgi:hypothetical protein
MCLATAPPRGELPKRAVPRQREHSHRWALKVKLKLGQALPGYLFLDRDRGMSELLAESF